MRYVKFILNELKRKLSLILIILLLFSIFILPMVILIYIESSKGELYIEDSGLNFNDYCNLTNVDYTAILHDDPDGSARVEITEYLTFDVHASSKDNPYREIWRELPEDKVDGLSVNYDVESVTQILPNGEEIPYTETDKMYWDDEDYTPSSTFYWHHSDGYGDFPDNDESLLIYIPWTYRDKLTFKIVYSMNNAALKYNDCSELYLDMYSGDAITKLESYKAQILIPNELMPRDYYAYTFGTSNDRIPYIESDSLNPGYHTFEISLDKSQLKFNNQNKYLEFCLLAYGKDKHSFTQYAPSNRYTSENVLDECIEENEYYANQNIKYKAMKKGLLIASILGSILTVIFTIKKYKKTKKTYTFYKPEIDYDFFRDIPNDLDPIFASDLVFMKNPLASNKQKQEEYAAILLSLVRKKYVKLSKVDLNKDWSNKNTIISLEPIYVNSTTPEFSESENYSPEPIYTTISKATGEKLEELTTSERLYLELLQRYSKNTDNTITLNKLQRNIDLDFMHTNAFVKDMEKKPILENGVWKGYFQTVEYDAPKKSFIKSANSSYKLALLLLIIVNLISYNTPLALSFGAYTIFGITLLWRYIYLSVKSNDLILLTQYGANEQAKWYGLYNFLNSETLIKERNVHELPLWEKYLIYATAFGISEKVIKAIKINVPELDMNNSLILNRNSFIHSHNFHRTSRSFGHSIHTSSRGGGFSGHGYGGGGRGGGGGGGGH